MDIGQSTQQTVHHALTAATVGGGILGWLTVNSTLATVLTVMTTGVASIVIGLWNARSNSKRNEINKRDITNSILENLEKGGKSDEYICDLVDAMRK